MLGLFRGASGSKSKCAFDSHLPCQIFMYKISLNPIWFLNHKSVRQKKTNICYRVKNSCSGEGAGGGAVEADVPEDQQDLAGAPFLPAMLEQVS